MRRFKTNNLPDKPSVNPGFAHWFAGFVDGEGCFSFVTDTTGTTAPRFCISLRADDKPTLEFITNSLGFGNIYHKNGWGNSKPQVSLHITSSACWRLVELFDQFPLQSKKKRDFAIWRQAVDAYITWPKTPGREQYIRNLKADIQECRKYPV